MANMATDRISEADLLKQYNRAAKEWPFIRDIEITNDLPRYLLFAIGSRETNLRNIRGDRPVGGGDGHGWGIFQRDDRSWPIPVGYLAMPNRQAKDASNLIEHLHDIFKDWTNALAAYNAGPGRVRRAIAEDRDPDFYTTGKNYGTETYGRAKWLQNHLPKWENVTYSVGDKGSAVKSIQSRLNSLISNDITSDTEVDGIFGSGTKFMVKVFQTSRNLDNDGKVGYDTWKRLF